MKAGNKTYGNSSDIPATIPVFPLSGALLLPGGQLPLNIFEPRYVKMIDDAIAGDKIIGMVQPCLKPENADIDPPPLCKIGCMGRISAYQESGDGRYLISLTGICRYEIEAELDEGNPYRSCRISPVETDLEDRCRSAETVDRKQLLDAFGNYLRANGMDADWATVKKTSTDTLVTALCMMSPYEPAEKQALLEAPDIKTRADTLITISEMYLAQQNGDKSNRLQ